MAYYFLSPALAQLRAEINARWPGRSKASDGWIGDTSHQARPSDHNPDWSDGGIVRAIDVTNDGIDVDGLINLAIRDPRTRYVISRGRIWTREAGWQRYTGANRHDKHVHISVRSVGNYDRDTSRWGLSAPVQPAAPPAPPPPPPPDDLEVLMGYPFIIRDTDQSTWTLVLSPTKQVDIPKLSPSERAGIVAAFGEPRTVGAELAKRIRTEVK